MYALNELDCVCSFFIIMGKSNSKCLAFGFFFVLGGGDSGFHRHFGGFGVPLSFSNFLWAHGVDAISLNWDLTRLVVDAF